MILVARYRSVADGRWTVAYRIEDDGELWRVTVSLGGEEAYRSCGMALPSALRLLEALLRAAPGKP